MYVIVGNLGQCLYSMDFGVAFSDEGDCVVVLMGVACLSHSRCLQDNNWDYTRSAQAFTHLKVRFGNHARRRASGRQEGAGGGSLALLTSLFLQAKGEIPEVAFMK